MRQNGRDLIVAGRLKAWSPHLSSAMFGNGDNVTPLCVGTRSGKRVPDSRTWDIIAWPTPNAVTRGAVMVLVVTPRKSSDTPRRS